ncbi:MAG TPA: NAD(P)-dependent oxidoreductase [Ideonella sp.]|uniref:NAD(P)-dependent oxidoreductase n=1 Tax=Ideonella sp. TaxID=1929293 RepID=UPI002B837E5E|nr:NAD(P)-dependent oxidoreductase [Ideonella sp.]HSI47276.1 NAD(P)-dependent oxidoreductase [Ideonella sp.]
MKILIPEAMHADSVARLQAAHEVRYEPSLVDRPADLLAAAPEADALIVRNRTQVRGPLLAALSRCRVVGRLGVGLDNIDLETCRARGIEVIPAIGANARSVAEYVLTTAMMLRRLGSYTATADVAAGRWPRGPASQGREMAGAVIGIIGFGSIGQLTASLAQGIGMRVIASATGAPDERLPELAGVPLLSLDEMLAQSDVLSLHLPLTPETCGLLGAEQLARMKPGAVLINTARGGVVDTIALLDALRAGRLHGAALDVFDTEPLPAGSAFAEPPPNLLLTPHIAGLTTDSERRVCELVTGKVLALLGGGR